MVTRRDFLAGSVAAAALSRVPSAFAKPSQPSTAVNFDVPSNACDCHTHIHMPQFPWYEGRVYTPDMAMPDEMSALHKALRIQRVVIVTPSVYGTDNRPTLVGMQARGRDARGVAVIDDKTSDAELDAMGKQGVCGIRLNLATGGTNDPGVAAKRFQNAAERMKARKWHVQLNTSLAMISALRQQLAASPVTIVVDHFGNARETEGPQQAGFDALVDLVRSGVAYVKISVNGGPRSDYSGFAPLARALIAANPDRIVWGTNWPHPNSATPPGRKPTDVTPVHQVDDGLVLNQLAVWVPDSAVRRKILVDNPARLYGF
ncbi:MAG TPA: amidohydrolase family protein [Burkholderiales bacterium]|nr:amidohydrolase family protein [Burkholderiales bacterium]